MKKLKVFLLLVLLLIIPTKALAINEVNIYFFYDDNSDICKQEKVYLDALKQRYSNMRIYLYEINDTSNNELMLKAKEMYNLTTNGIPFTVIGDKAYLGFSQSKKASFQKTVYEYSKTTYENKLGKSLGINYRNDLEGEVKEYKDNADYQIEETSGKTHYTQNNNDGFDKYKVTFYLVGAGIILAIIAGVVYLIERKK